jgi:hypothetical protein
LGTSFIESNELLNGGIEINGVSAQVYIRKNIISSDGSVTGINFTSVAGGRIDSNTVTLPYITPTGAPPEYDSAAICALRIKSIAFGGLYNNLLEGGNYAVYLTAVASQIVHNSITDSDRGVYVDGVACRIDSNSVTNCADDGMIFSNIEEFKNLNILKPGNGIRLNSNLIKNNGGNGIRLRGDFVVLGTDTSGYNDIRDNAGYDLYVEVPKTLTDTIFAKNNHWTHITESEISEFDIYDQNDDTTLALVIFTPFLLTDIKDDEKNNLTPTDFALYQNYPNPFNPGTKISWQSPVGNWQTLRIYDVLGNHITTLVDEYRPAGSYEVEFITSSINYQTSSGIYFYQLRAGDFIQTKKMVLIK